MKTALAPHVSYLVQRIGVSLLLFFALATIFGAGCKRTPPQIPSANENQPPATQEANNKQDQDQQMQEVEVGDPATLAILLLTQESQVTVARGDESTDAVHQMELYAGDEVSVIKGEAQLLYPEVGMSVLPEGTRITIIPGEDAENGGFSSQILLEAGKIWTRLEHVLGTDEDFSVEASNVVATVRGTAFGVSFVNGEIDIKVAGNQVAVSTREALKNLKETAQKAVLVASGNALKIDPANLKPGENPRPKLLAKLRKVSQTEKKDLYYRFGTRRLNITDLKKPEQTFKWSAPIGLKDKVKERLTPEQIEKLKAIQDKQIRLRPELLEDEARLRNILQDSVRFQTPLRQVILEEMTTDETPSATGPSN
ncbi:hypothetical protein GF391_04040 [Candidatus Uhrbacteria bacterium]|nr:hypothetical protein [Candidatus Uhrbacteria bacterium]